MLYDSPICHDPEDTAAAKIFPFAFNAVFKVPRKLTKVVFSEGLEL